MVQKRKNKKEKEGFRALDDRFSMVLNGPDGPDSETGETL